jgi:hypothetical protein
MVGFSQNTQPNITVSETIEVASGKMPLMTRFSIAYASTSMR